MSRISDNEPDKIVSSKPPLSGQMLGRIVLLSVLILFLEMLLVRWIGTEVRVFAYLQNAVLVAAFLGLGLGARNARHPVRLFPGALALVFIGVVVRDPSRSGIAEVLSEGLTAFEDSVIWGRSLAPQAITGDLHYLRARLVVFSLLMTLALLAAVAWVFMPLGQWLGRLLDNHSRPIVAYTANIVGSIVGIALFDIATIARTAPWLWLLPVACGFAIAAIWAEEDRMVRIVTAGLMLALPWFGRPPDAAHTTWSPYQKLSREPLARSCEQGIRVNNVGYQLMINLDPAYMRAHPEDYPPDDVDLSHYILPHRIVETRERVLVVGSGSGNDVAMALIEGARSVHAVEIDPVIVAWGRDYHPNHPYADPRVTVTVDDARAFFRRDRNAYDLIWFGLLDSHTTPSAYTNVRLDHFVYTRESFVDMKRLLAPGGVVVLFFEAQKPWIADRLVGLLTETFGERPLVAEVRSGSLCLGFGGLMLIGGSPETLRPLAARAAADPRIAARLLARQPLPLGTTLTTDDWPYLYLEAPHIPKYHLLVGALAIVMGLVLRRRLFRPGEALELPMLLLGMGFMLLEIVGVSRAALLFGTTWTVNAYVVGAILASVLCANWIAARYPSRGAELPFAGLLATLVLLAVLPVSRLAGLPTALRVVVGGAFLALPVLFSGLLFVSQWMRSTRKDLALGSNLLGSLFGGVASMMSMLIGFRALTLLTLVIYVIAYLLMRRGPSVTSA